MKIQLASFRDLLMNRTSEENEMILNELFFVDKNRVISMVCLNTPKCESRGSGEATFVATMERH